MTNLHLDKTHQANKSAFDSFLAVDEAAVEAEAKSAANTFNGALAYHTAEKWGETTYHVDLGTGNANYNMSLTKPEAKALFNTLFEHRDDFLR